MIHIACCTDDTYAEHCGILMISICENKGESPIHFHILTNTIQESNEQTLRGIVERYGQTISVYKVDENDLKDCPIRKNDHVSIATYFRILLPVILPESVRKVLYLDCDILVLQALENLWAMDIERYSAGVVMDQRGGDIRFFNNLEYEMPLGYFNAGVMLFNLDYWRENNVTSKVLEYISDNPERLKFWDQDALNYVLRETKLEIPFQYNVQDGFYWSELWIAKKYWAKIYEATEKPVILHYTGGYKPWVKECAHPNRLLYQKYKSLSPWKEKKIGHVKFSLRVGLVIKKLAIKLGLMQERISYRKEYLEKVM